MSNYDWQRIRGVHPQACTCTECVEAYLARRWQPPPPVPRTEPPPEAKAAEAEKLGQTPRLVPPPAHPRSCQCYLCKRTRVRDHHHSLTRKRKKPKRRVPVRTVITTVLALGFLVWLAVLLWPSGGSPDASEGGGSQVEADGGSWFSLDCERERRRRRGGWLRELIC